MAFDYTKYNYDELVAEVTRLLQETDEWKDAYHSSTGQVLIQLMAAMTDNLHYMLERRTQENFLPTAKLPSSVGAISNLLGYRPKRAVSSSGRLSLRLIDNNNLTIIPDGDISIPKYSSIRFDNKNFVNVDSINISPVDTPPYVFTVKEGLVAERTFDPTDPESTLFNKNYILIEDYEFIEDGSLYIYTDTQEFYDVKAEFSGNPALESLAFAGPNDPAYDLRITNRGLQIMFGNGINGQEPQGTLRVKWINSSGASVDIPSTGVEFQFEQSSLEDDSVPQNSYSYELLNIDSINGGLDPESVEETKRNAPDYIRTSARAVTKDDYNYWTRRAGIGGIIDSSVYGEEEIGTSVINANNVYITYLNATGSSLTSTELQDLRDYLDTYKTVTTHLVITPAELIPLQLNIRLKRSPFVSASNSELFDFVRRSVVERFGLGQGSLGEQIHLSDIINYITSLELMRGGIARKITEYVKIDIRGLKEFAVPYSTTDDLNVVVAQGLSGNIYQTNINGVPFELSMRSGETAGDLSDRLASKVNFSEEVNATSDGSGNMALTLDSNDRTNLVLHSEDFSDAYWTKQFSNIVSSAEISPRGFGTVQKLEETTDVGRHSLIVSGLDQGLKTFVIRAKAAERTNLTISYYHSISGRRSETVFDVQSGTVVSGPGSIVALADDWYECSVTDSSSVYDNDEIHITTHDGAGTSYTGIAGEGVHLWGAQLERESTYGGYLETTDSVRDLGPAVNPYTISFNGTTTDSDLSCDITIQIPLSTLNNEDGDYLILPGSVELVDSAHTVLATDDGSGNIYGGTVNYETGEMVINLPAEDTYYVRYSQDQDDNFLANQKQAFIYSEPKQDYSDTQEELSTIEILD